MRIRGIEFGRVFCSSGTLGFFGDGYWYHRLGFPLSPDYNNITFVSKTTTLYPRRGNMPLKTDGITPENLLPSCIKIKPFDGVVLNAVGLSGPGAFSLLSSGMWQQRKSPFFISFMSVEKTAESRMLELEEFIRLLKSFLPSFGVPFGLEINFSCPNVGVNSELILETSHASMIVQELKGIPVVPNLSCDVNPEEFLKISQLPFDAISVSNTIKYGKIPDRIDWSKYWDGVSPLENLGGGGISGRPLFPIVHSLIRQTSGYIKKPIIAGGGILSLKNAESMFRAGASAIKLGTIGMLRPWRVKPIIDKYQR